MVVVGGSIQGWVPGRKSGTRLDQDEPKPTMSEKEH
jgi:hypothetical protein